MREKRRGAGIVPNIHETASSSSSRKDCHFESKDHPPKPSRAGSSLSANQHLNSHTRHEGSVPNSSHAHSASHSPIHRDCGVGRSDGDPTLHRSEPQTQPHFQSFQNNSSGVENELEDAFNSMLMAWYQSGYATGRYQALLEVSRGRFRDANVGYASGSDFENREFRAEDHTTSTQRHR
jgi:hypothetical protein